MYIGTQMVKTRSVAWTFFVESFVIVAILKINVFTIFLKI